jgi:hypothetical protein
MTDNLPVYAFAHIADYCRSKGSDAMAGIYALASGGRA